MAGKAGSLNLFVNKHATFECYLTWTTGGDNPTPIDVAGFQALMQVRHSFDSPNVLFEASTTNGLITLPNILGRIVIRISSKQTGEIRFDKALYDLILKAPNGTVRRIVEGEFIVRSGMSQFKA